MSTVPIGTLLNLPEVLNELGFDGWGFMLDFALQPESFVKPLQPVPMAFCGELLQRAVIFTQCDELPMLLGAKAKMANLGPLRFLIASSGSVREAVNVLTRFRRLWFSGFQIALHEERGIASMAIDFSGSFLGHQAIRTCYLTAMVRHLDLILGRRFPLRQVHLSRSLPANTAVYRRHFGLAPAFAQARDVVFFDAALLELKRPAVHDPELDYFLRQQLEAMEATLGSSFAEQVAELIESLLIGGRCSVEQVAQVLGIHRLTLYRRLQAQGTTFEALLDQRRRALAESMLQRPAIAIAEIADALGYSAPSNFARAFQRWTGVSPKAWRQQHGAE
ncbi:AraC family transcriptional regulator [Pseudomonas sp. N040]|uniref:AraC family transcriptional regulator n=1 Tax=Pseudomonas sp. N040 TaxID=2785325 RepID=UPI0018A3091E|nr:AraC family transcriptional regulator [Pseudomonas sp. N040]MBF7731560.1 AraC family transcriptional regulator ligand-binding domain-containing protein [Pseudomonas sp. N040]MBW7015204.1 AraC family transcriptional regulator [Pseudomonas sp. N040]